MAAAHLRKFAHTRRGLSAGVEKVGLDHWSRSLLTVSSYIESITPIMAKAQITNGGPIILFQPENEYSMGQNNVTFPDADYMNSLMQQYRDLGIVVPMINNVAWPSGINAPGTDAPVDIYGHNSYPLGMNCSDPKNWADDALPTNWRELHLEQSPNTPYLLVEVSDVSTL